MKKPLPRGTSVCAILVGWVPLLSYHTVLLEEMLCLRLHQAQSIFDSAVLVMIGPQGDGYVWNVRTAWCVDFISDRVVDMRQWEHHS